MEENAQQTESPALGDRFLPRASIYVSSWASLICALAVVVAIIGCPMNEERMRWVFAGTCLAVGAFFLQEILRFAFGKEALFRRFARHWGETVVFFCVVLAMICGAGGAVEFFENRFAEEVSPFFVRLTYAAVLNALVLWVLVLRGIRSRKSLLRGLPLTPGRVFILSFVLLIATGTLLLKTPNASVAGISWCDALFLSTSAVCVTGLSPVDIATDLTFGGQCILLVLIQLGGLGVMSITYFFAYFFAGGLTLKNRFDFQTLFSEENIGQIGMVLAVIVGFTFTAEAIGAVSFYCSAADAVRDTENPLFFSVFLAVSSFCNAGLVPNSAVGMADPRLSGNAVAVFFVLAMTLVGGLGFPVIKNFWLYFLDKLKSKLYRHRGYRVPVRLTTHTQLVLVTTFGLMIFGYLAFLLLGNAPERAFFLAGSSRTAGFDIASTAEISAGAKLILMGLMFIGGSPFSTAGGIKTTTFAVAILSLRQFVFGKRDLELFGRRLNSDVANYALAIVLLAGTAVFVLTVLLNVLHPEIDFLSLAFEATSAVGTVGLSCDVTARLGEPAKLLVAVAMFVGRIGVLLFITSFLPRRKNVISARFPETTIVLS